MYLLTEFYEVGKVFFYRFPMKKAFSLGKCLRWVLVGLPDVIFLYYVNASAKGHRLFSALENVVCRQMVFCLIVCLER